jgi:alpha-mannosidase
MAMVVSQVIDEYIRKTEDNFKLFDKYPHYVFNFSGANRYRLMKEYFPADFARLKKYVDEGRWFPAGSSMEEGDVNAPGAEGIIRQILYGNDWFRKELGKASAEHMLADCFGFPASLPTILAHSGSVRWDAQSDQFPPCQTIIPTAFRSQSVLPVIREHHLHISRELNSAEARITGLELR